MGNADELVDRHIDRLNDKLVEVQLDLREAESEIRRHHELIEFLKEYVRDQRALLAKYRLSGTPSGALLDRLAAHRERFAREVG